VSQENVELMREAYEAYNREGINGILAYLDPEVEWRNPIESPNAAVFVGHHGVIEWQRMVDDAFKDMHFQPEHISQLRDGRVLASVRFRFRAPTGDVQVDVPFTHLVTWRDGKVTALSMHSSETAALEAAGLEE
jgi:ketosteroid isomerase-like protein